jgi:hypothetical protein
LYPTSNKRTRIIVAIAPTPLRPPSSSPTSPSEPTAAQTIIEVWDIARVTLVESFVIDESGGKDIVSATGDGFTADQLRLASAVSNEGTSAADAIAAFVRARKAAQKAAHSPAPPSGDSGGPNPTIVEQDTSDTRTIRWNDEREDDDADSGILHDPDFEPPEIVAARSARDTRALLAGVNFGFIASSAPFFSSVTGAGGGGDGGFSPSTTMMMSEERRGFMLTGSVDRKITFWDLSGNRERSAVLSGLDASAEKPNFRWVDSAKFIVWCWVFPRPNEMPRRNSFA